MSNMISRSVLKRSSQRKISTIQRKANYSDRTRIRFAEIKKIALREGKCADSAQMKKRLKLLGVKLDLRLTSAWIAIVKELVSEIAALANVTASKEANQKAQIEVGSKVWWVNAPAFVESWGALLVLKISGEMAQLELLQRLIPLNELALSPA
jgi:hypothetical protein